MKTSDLLSAATISRSNAYAPYSGYKVGAAVRGKDGRVWAGCNIENASYGLTICAERSAVSSMVADGCSEISEALVLTSDGAMPCGACLQVLFEFAPDPAAVPVHLSTPEGPPRSFKLSELMPHAFRSKAVKRTEP